MSRPVRAAERRAVLWVGDLLAIVLSVLLALWTWSLTAGFPFDFSFLRARAIWWLVAPVWLFALGPTRTPDVSFDRVATARGVLRAAAGLFFLYLAAFFYAGGDRLPRLVALYIIWDATLLTLGWRFAAEWSLSRAAFARRWLVVGDGPTVALALDVLADPVFRDSVVVGLLTSGPAPPSSPSTLGRPDEVDSIAARHGITDIVITADTGVEDVWIDRLLRCQQQGIHVVRAAQLYETTRQRVPVEHIEASWLLTSFFDVARYQDRVTFIKRAIDLVSGVMLAGLAVALTPLIVLAILAESGWPVLYRQTRLGRGGHRFSITKFRTMRRDAEAGGAQWSQRDDPRVTPVGRFLRRTRLDELPNVLALLRGDMSLIGPRPERPEFVEDLERRVPFYRARLIVRPGLTGWAQVNHRYGDSVEDAVIKLEYDLYYIKHQSLWLDLLVIWRTVVTVLRLRGR